MEGEVTALPAMWRHCLAVYEKMAEGASPVVSGEEKEVHVYWDGFTTHIFSELGIAVPYYGKVLKTLRKMGCIQQVRRGGSTTPSRWEITGEPTLEKFVEVYDSTNPTRDSVSTRLATLEQKVNMLAERVGDVNVPQALIDLKLAIANLQEEVRGSAA